MNPVGFPVPLAKAVMSLMPGSVLARAVEIVVRRMEGRHPKLFKNLAQLSPALVVLEPTDLPHRFALVIGRTPPTFYVLAQDEAKPDARVRGSLEALIAMLEGREDGDTLFFSRDIQVTGDTSVIVGLRNTLDREEMDLFAEVTALCGPFAKPAGLAMTVADRAARRLKERLAQFHEELHQRQGAGHP